MISIETLQPILFEYGLTDPEITITPHGNGLINNTWKVSGGRKEYIFQRINDNVFKEPLLIENNIRLIAEHIKKYEPGYLFAAPLKARDGREMIVHQEGYFRLFPFIKDSHTIDVATKPEHAFEAAKQFGLFTKTLTAFPVNALGLTIPDFHNLSLRGQQFKQAGMHGNPQRTKRSVDAIQFLLDNTDVIYQFEKIRTNADFKLRVTHHDTKISNVLFDKNGKGLCVIDLDTVMPGYFISDVGDMMRTYLSPANEEEKDFSKIEVREDFFSAIVRGYLQNMAGDLGDTEKNHFVYAGKFIIYMQALRFLTDYLNNDTYYGAKYEDHNYVRANNQIVLFKKLVEKENLMNKIVQETLS